MVQNKGNTSKLYIFLTVTVFLQAAIILLSCSIGYAQSSQAIIANREPYVHYAIRALPDLLFRIDSKHKEFRQQLTAEESDQYDLLLNLLNEKIFKARMSFPGGYIDELFDSIGLKYDFSSNSQDFILPDGKPERSAKTNSEWATPIVFNRNILNNFKSQINLLDIIQILVHELGHKLGDKKNQTAIDQLSAKLKSFLKRFYSVDFNEKNEIIEVLSLQGDAKEIKIGIELGVVDLTTGLIFFTNSQKNVEPISKLFRLKEGFWKMKRFSSYGYNLVDDLNFRIVGIKLGSEKLPMPKFSFIVDFVEEASYMNRDIPLFNFNNRSQIGKAFYPLTQAESYRATITYSYKHYPARDNNRRFGWYNFEINAWLEETEREMRQTGVLNNFELSLDQSDNSKLKIFTRSKIGSAPNQTILVVKGMNSKIHLKPSSVEQNNGFEYRTYQLTISKDVPMQTVEIGSLADTETYQEVALAKPLKFQVGFKPIEKNQKVTYVTNIFYDEGNGWKRIDKSTFTPIASIEPNFAFQLSSEFKAREIRIIWKKGASILYNNEEAGVVSGFETEVFNENEFTQIHQDGENLFTVKSKKYSVPFDPVSLIDFFQIKDNGLREIKEVILIGQDLITSSDLAPV